MIIQSLVALYQRLADSDDHDVPQPGWQKREIGFEILLDPDGRPVNMVLLREAQSKGRARGQLRVVPQESTRSGQIPREATEKDCGKASLFWDNPKYALGLVPADDAKSRREANVCHGLFKLRHQCLASLSPAGAEDEGLRALLCFLDRGAASALQDANPAWVKEIREAGANVAFRLDGEARLICRRPAIREAIAAMIASGEERERMDQCLATGATTRIARLHEPAIKGVLGAQTSGARLVSFNEDAFKSYGFSKGENAPVGTFATFAYATALNWLLQQGSPHRTRAGGITVVFWAGRETPNEATLCDALVILADNPSRDVAAVERLYAVPRTGVLPPLGDTTPFFVLGLSAESKSRLTVRFFHQSTVAGISQAIKRWFDELAIAPQEGPSLSARNLLRGLAVQGDIDKAPPLLEAELLHAAYTGGKLPHRVLAEALVRCAAERGPTRERAALIKLFLIRNENRRITVPLDPDEPDPAYRLGRLLAVLEWVQERATGAKAGIAERYWGSATTTPAAVFPELLKLAIFHLAKLGATEPGFATNRRKDIEQIFAGLPSHLAPRFELVEQGAFAIGYWHQCNERRQAAADKAAAATAGEQRA